MAEQPQGTEYTLQGVMRFLQMEWHNHERARNAWDIERAEMKIKIAKQEGENRSLKKLNEALEKQIRMLEKALKTERAAKRASVDEIASEDKETNGEEQEGGVKKGTTLLPTEPGETESETDRNKVHTYVHRMGEELTYLLSSPSQPTPSHANAQALQLQQQQQQQAPYQDQHPSVEDVYLLKPQQHMQRRGQDVPQQGQSSYSSQQRYDISQPMQQSMRQMPNQSFVQPDSSQQTSTQDTTQFNEQVENVATYETYRRIDDRDPGVKVTAVDDPDAWDFDETTPSTEGEVATLTRRPDTDIFPTAPPQSPTRSPQSRRKSSSSGGISMLRRRSEGGSFDATSAAKAEASQFKVRFALRGHLDVVRSIIFTGGGSPSEPEICTTGDDGTIKRWYIPASFGSLPPGASSSQTQASVQQQQQQPPVDLDIQSYFTHRGHEGCVTSLAASPASSSFSTGGRVTGDGWVFSGGQDATIRVWERGRVDAKATLDGHTDAVWALCVLPATFASVFGPNDTTAPQDRILLLSGAADHTIKLWAVSAPPLTTAPPQPSRRGVGPGGARRNSVTSGSAFPSSPQPSVASGTPFHYTLLLSIDTHAASPTSISALGPLGETFVVGYADAAVLIYDTRTGDEVIGMASGETYDGTPSTGVNSVVVASTGAQGMDSAGAGAGMEAGGGLEDADDAGVHGATGDRKSGGVEGVVISGHEDRFVRFFDANSGQCTYSMLAHPASISSLSLSPDGREMVTGGHDAGLRFWSLERRSCVQEISTSLRACRGEGVCCVVWSADGRWVVAGGGEGVVKVFAR